MFQTPESHWLKTERLVVVSEQPFNNLSNWYDWFINKWKGAPQQPSCDSFIQPMSHPDAGHTTACLVTPTALESFQNKSRSVAGHWSCWWWTEMLIFQSLETWFQLLGLRFDSNQTLWFKNNIFYSHCLEILFELCECWEEKTVWKK